MARLQLNSSSLVSKNAPAMFGEAPSTPIAVFPNYPSSKDGDSFESWDLLWQDGTIHPGFIHRPPVIKAYIFILWERPCKLSLCSRRNQNSCAKMPGTSRWLIVSSAWSQSGQRAGCGRPHCKRWSAVHHLLWATSHIKNLHFPGAQDFQILSEGLKRTAPWIIPLYAVWQSSCLNSRNTKCGCLQPWAEAPPHKACPRDEEIQ